MDPIRTPAQLAEQVFVPLTTIYQWNSKRSGPRYIRVGRHVRYRQSDIDAWLDAHAVDPRPAA